jgi:MFS family permease
MTSSKAHDRVLFLGCFVALIATAFGFIVRAMLINTWGAEFGLTETQKGEIFGVGLWPFAISIVLFSLVIDHVGYGKAMVFAFLCHVGSAVLTIFAWDYWSLYWATFIVALGNGTVEAVINPVVATMFSREKTKWLNILHAGWPGGLVLGGVLAIGLGDVDWRWKVGLLLIPAAIYGVLLTGKRFPIQERVAAGVSHRDMLREAGGLGMLIVVFLIAAEFGRVVGFGTWTAAGIALVVGGAFGAYVRGLGRPMFIFLLLVMMPLATTELGTDSWITPLMEGEMTALGLSPLWVLIYTAFIMMVLRLYAGPIVDRLSPLGLLIASSLIAALGLVFLSQATGMMIFVAATLYACGKTFFWPTTLGVVSERFPRGGALTINAIAGVGMLSVGVVGTVFLGYFQDTETAARLQETNPALHASVIVEKDSVLGSYAAIDPARTAALKPAEKEAIATISQQAQKSALATVAIFPTIMLLCYLGLALWFRARGGYRAEVLGSHGSG